MAAFYAAEKFQYIKLHGQETNRLKQLMINRIAGKNMDFARISSRKILIYSYGKEEKVYFSVLNWKFGFRFWTFINVHF